MKIFKYLVAVIILLSASAYSLEGYVNYPPKLRVVDTGYESSWWERTQYYNGVPKYSGAFGTYTHKHIPLAVKSGNHVYHVTTNNADDGNFYVYVMKDYVERVIIHTIPNWNDPHTNAVISVNGAGYIEIHIASRGLKHKFQSGKIYRSTAPHTLDFECIDGCNSVNFEAYPQLHHTDWGLFKLYTHYEHEPDEYITAKRRSWSVDAAGNRTKLSTREHYQVSHYNSLLGQLCVAMNTLVDGHPDYRIDLRFMCTEDGDYWFNDNYSRLVLPVSDSSNVVLDSSKVGGGHYFIYLKDIYYFKGKWRVLFTKSESDDPTKGKRWLMEYVKGEGIKVVTEVGHNYSAAAYIERANKMFIVVGKSSVKGYLSGNLHLYNLGYVEVDVLEGDYSYVRRVMNGGSDGLAVASEGSSSDKSSKGKHVFIIME